MTDIDDVRSVVSEARDDLVREEGLSAIDGACHKNAIFLCEYCLAHTDWQPYLRWGAVEDYKSEFDNLEEAEESGAVHFWVQVKPDSTWFFMDVFSMQSRFDELCRGDVLVATTLPKSYNPLEETLFKYDSDIIDPVDILSYEDYTVLTDVIEPIE